MGFFSRKKKEEKELPPLKFPKLPEEFPKYESEISPREASTIKEAIMPHPEVPIREPSIKPFEPKQEEKTLFVKIDKYKKAIKTLNDIKNKISECEQILNKINSLKSEEDRELSIWHANLEELKDKLLQIDKTLFEK